MTSRYPYAEVIIQRRRMASDTVKPSPGQEPAIKVTTDGAVLDATISSAVGDNGGLSALQVDIWNMDPDTIALVEANGFIQVNAGYKESDAVPVQPIFLGEIQDSYPYYQGAEMVYRILAHTNPSRLMDMQVHVELKDVTIADAIQTLLEAVGATLGPVSRAARGVNPGIPNNLGRVTMTSYSTLPRPVSVELQALVGALSTQTGHPHQLVPYNSQGAPFSYALVDLSEGLPQLIQLNFPEDTVYSTGQSEMTVNTQPTILDPSNPTGSINTVQSQSKQKAFIASIPLDPRFQVGFPVEVREEGGYVAEMVVTSVKHRIGRNWQTDFKGPMQRADVQMSPGVSG